MPDRDAGLLFGAGVLLRARVISVSRRKLSWIDTDAQGKVINVQPGFLGWFLKTHPGMEQIA